jgi:transglutaminase-like putative cysteine protease
MRLTIEHDTVYRYETPVTRSTQYLRLTPRAGSRLPSSTGSYRSRHAPARGSTLMAMCCMC